MNEILFAPQGLMASGYDLFRGETKIGRLTYSIFGSGSSFLIDDESFQVEEGEMWERTFTVSQGSRKVLKACVEGILTWKLNVTYDDGTIALRPARWSNSEMHVWNDDTEVGRIEASGFWGRKGRSQLPESLPPGVTGFLIWVTVLHWRQAGGGGGE